MSCVRTTQIKIVGQDGYTFSGNIGEFIDNLIDTNKKEVVDIGNDSVVLDLKDDYKIVGVSNDEKTSWMRISQVSRHPANGGLVKITTASGKTTTATLSHSFLKRTEKGIEPIRGSELVIGMKVPVAQDIPASNGSGTITWEEIVDITYLDDPKDYVYDFTVPGNDSFMVDEGILVHNTLNTFHLSGVSSASKAVRGLPRIKELLSVTKNIKTPALMIHLKEQYKRDKMKAKEVLNTIQTTYFSDIVKSTKIYYDPDDFETTIEDDKEFLQTYKEFINKEMIDVSNLPPWLLRLEFDRDKMLEYDITMIDVYNSLQDFYEEGISVMFSDDNASKLIFRIKINEADEKQDDIITNLKALEKNIMENLIVKGVKNISKVVMTKMEPFEYNKQSMTFDKTVEWILETSGTNLKDILAHRQVDAPNTVSNDINEIYELLGIEAARQALYNELWDVIKHADLYVNYRHLALLVETMCNKGYLLSIDRHGINRVDIGPLAKSSFEETNDMIIKAGIFAEIDKINGVSANIMLGQIPPCGTGDTNILIDEALLSDVYVAPKEVEELSADEVCQNIKMDYIPPEAADNKKKKKPQIKIV